MPVEPPGTQEKEEGHDEKDSTSSTGFYQGSSPSKTAMEAEIAPPFMRGRNKETPLSGRRAGDIIASGVMQRRLRSALRIFNDASITNSHCKFVEVAALA